MGVLTLIRLYRWIKPTVGDHTSKFNTLFHLVRFRNLFRSYEYEKLENELDFFLNAILLSGLSGL